MYWCAKPGGPGIGSEPIIESGERSDEKELGTSESRSRALDMYEPNANDDETLSRARLATPARSAAKRALHAGARLRAWTNPAL